MVCNISPTNFRVTRDFPAVFGYPSDISAIISIDIENEFKEYKNELPRKIINKEQMKQLILEKIIRHVDYYLDNVSKQFKREYGISLFYGLCMNLNLLVQTVSRAGKI